jgi:hypothetical protein
MRYVVSLKRNLSVDNISGVSARARFFELPIKHQQTMAERRRPIARRRGPSNKPYSVRASVLFVRESGVHECSSSCTLAEIHVST